MPKSKIIKDAVEDAVSLDKSLYRLYVIAKDISNEPLALWAESELHGYQSKSDIPDYRKSVNLELMYTGFNGRTQIKNAPLPYGFLSKDTIESITHIYAQEDIRSVEEMAQSESSPRIDRTYLANEIYKESEGSLQCVAIYQVLPQAFFRSILSQVKSKLIAALIKLEKEYGNLDGLGVDISNLKQSYIDQANAELNKTVLNINVPTPAQAKEPWHSKLAWRIIVPIATAIIGAVAATAIIRCTGM
ncbi:MAG: hypothetical protein PEGG_00724 [Paraeggerthella hongkongensis]